MRQVGFTGAVGSYGRVAVWEETRRDQCLGKVESVWGGKAWGGGSGWKRQRVQARTSSPGLAGHQEAGGLETLSRTRGPVCVWICVGVCVCTTGVKVRVRRVKAAGSGSGNGMVSFMGRGQQRMVLMWTVSFKVSGMLLVGWAKGF